jgi:hypothetical protein
MRAPRLLPGGGSGVGGERCSELGCGGHRRPAKLQTGGEPHQPDAISSCFIDAMLQTCVLDVSDVQEQCPKRFVLMLQNKS